MPDPTRLLTDALPRTGTGWSMGSFGAIAEFHHVAGDPPAHRLEGCALVTDRGGLRLIEMDKIHPVAWEALSPKPHRWQQGIALCMPADRAAMSGRTVLTELGADADALRPADRAGVLFDMGLAQVQVDFCIRTADPDLIAHLRSQTGLALTDPDSHAMPAILAAHPHRVALSRIGRVEVFQKIGGPDTGGVSPTGPHTHVLPQLLRSKRTHSSNTPIPEGLVPLAGLHPDSPVMDSLGADRDFDPKAFVRFQQMLADWGDPGRVALKAQVWALLSQGAGPDDIVPPTDRFGRVALRVALRQAERRDGPSALLTRWRGVFDRDPAQTDDEDAPGH